MAALTWVLAAVVAGVACHAAVRREASPFLALFTVGAMAAALGRLPRGLIEGFVLAGLMALWVESAGVAKKSGVGEGQEGPPGEAEAASSSVLGSLTGLIAGSALWYGGWAPVPLPVLGAYGGAFFMALAGGLEPGRGLLQALLLVERGSAGSLLQCAFGGALLLSLFR